MDFQASLIGSCDVALGVTDVLNVGHVSLAADFGPNQSLEPIKRVDGHGPVGVLFDVQLGERGHRLLERIGQRKLVAADFAEPVLGLDENWRFAGRGKGAVVCYNKVICDIQLVSGINPDALALLFADRLNIAYRVVNLPLWKFPLGKVLCG